MPYYDDAIKYILLFITLVFILWINAKIKSATHRKDFKWEQRYLEVIEDRKAKAKEQQAYIDSVVTLDNKFLINLSSKGRIFLFDGMPGDGKTLSADMFSKWLHDRQEDYDLRKKRYNHYMRPDYIKQKTKLVDAGLLNVYDNLGMVLDNLHTQDVIEVITLAKQALQNAILVLDEAGHYFPKEKYFELLKTKDKAMKAEFDRLIEFVRFIRHYINGYLIMTEQDPDNIFIGVRRTGYTRIHCAGTKVYLTRKGKILLALKTLANTVLPGYIIGKPLQSIMGARGLKNKFVSLIKLLGINWLNGFIYYEQQNSISDNIEEEYTEYKVTWEINDNKKKYMIFNNSNLFKYNTRNRKSSYFEHFDKEPANA